MQSVAQASGYSREVVSFPFIAYCLCFALALVPAGRIELRWGPRRLIWGGLVMAAGGLLMLLGDFGFLSIILARAFSGVGQGILFIGVQSYILRATSHEARTRGNSIIVAASKPG